MMEVDSSSLRSLANTESIPLQHTLSIATRGLDSGGRKEVYFLWYIERVRYYLLPFHEETNTAFHDHLYECPLSLFACLVTFLSWIPGSHDHGYASCRVCIPVNTKDAKHNIQLMRRCGFSAAVLGTIAFNQINDA